MTTATDTNRGYEIDRDARLIRFTRHFAASPERVFAAWTDPTKLARWWDPTGQPLAACEMDLREGGAFRFVNRGHEDMPFAGTFTRIDPPIALGLAVMGATSLTRFTAEGDGTRMVMEMRCASSEQLEQFVAMGIADGTAMTLGNLERFVDGAA